MGREDRETYVHRPASDDADGDAGLDARQSWLLVAVVAFAGIVAPLAVYLWPPSFLGYKNAYMAAAMVPALVLAVAALWSVQAS